MTTQTAPVRRRDTASADGTRLGAALGIASIVLIAAGFAIASPTEATIASPESEVLAFYSDAGLAKTLAGGLIETLGLVLFLPFAAMLAGRVAGAGTREVLASTARMAATVYVAICLAPGMSAGAAALWLAHHGTADPAVLTALNDLRSLSYFVALLPFAVFLVCVGLSAAGRLPRWAEPCRRSSSAIALAASLPFAAYDATDLLGLIGLVWVLAVVGGTAAQPVGRHARVTGAPFRSRVGHHARMPTLRVALLWATAAAATVAAAAAAVVAWDAALGQEAARLAEVPLIAACSGIGALILTSRPGQPVGRALLAGGALWGLASLPVELLVASLAERPASGGGALLADRLHGPRPGLDGARRRPPARLPRRRHRAGTVVAAAGVPSPWACSP